MFSLFWKIIFLWLSLSYILRKCQNQNLKNGNMQGFSCGNLYYRTLHLDNDRNVLYVGAMDKIFRLKLQNISESDCEGDSLILYPTNVDGCISKGKSRDYDCRNHIRVIQPMEDGSRLYICGTNAHSPKDWNNLTHLPRPEYVPGIGSGIAKCPFDPSDNNTAIWVESGNPGNLPGLYSGTVAEFTKADTVIFRTDLYEPVTKHCAYGFQRTLKYDSKWLDKPNFVGSFDLGSYILFFFRETAVEYINCGKSIFSRVARVCKKDTGGKNILVQNWATYLKARLNCSIPGEFPFYFNEIQHVYQKPQDLYRFYAIFTTSLNGLKGSAICTYTEKSIQNAFFGRYKEQATSSSAWLPVLSSNVPQPRPGTCMNDTHGLPDIVLNFLRTHPLMDEAVAHEGGSPVFYLNDVVFTRLVVDQVLGDYTVYFVGSQDGKIYKVVQWNNNGRSHSNLLDVFDVMSPESIRALAISQKHKSLYVTSDRGVKQVPLLLCKVRYSNCFQCVRDPYCGWDGRSCKPFKYGLLQDVSHLVSNICQGKVIKQEIIVHWGQSVHLPCKFHLPINLNNDVPKWYHNNHLMKFSPDKFVQTSEFGLVILSAFIPTSGTYECKLRDNTLFTFNVTVDKGTCTVPSHAHDFRQAYADWCKEFHKYKMAMNHWQQKQMYCSNVSIINGKHYSSFVESTHL